MKGYKNIAHALEVYFRALETLNDLGILTNKKDFTGQVGEWLVETLYDGKRATNPTQKGWDVDVNGKHIQVKTHAKSISNSNRWSGMGSVSSEKIDELIIIVFTQDYKLKEFYRVDWKLANERIQVRGKKTKKQELTWKSINEFKIDFDSLPKQDIVRLFR